MAVDIETLLAARTLAIDLWSAEAIAALEAAGVDVLLLKGPAIAGWVYGDAPRSYVDADLLVSPTRLGDAEDVLQSLDYTLRDPEGEEELVSGPHAQTWMRKRDGSLIDLHHTLPGGPVGDEIVWRALHDRAGTIEVHGLSLPVLGEPSRAVLLAVHAAHHGGQMSTPIADLGRGVACLPFEIWSDAVLVADLIRVLPLFAEGLRLIPEGAALATRLGLPEADVLHTLHRRPIVSGLERVVRAGGTRARAGLLWRYAFPSPIYMHRWAGWSRGSRLRLAAAYVVRAFWIVGRAVPAYRTWRRARAVSSR